MARLTKKVKEQILQNWTEKKWSSKFKKAVEFVAKEAEKQITCLMDELDVTEDIKAELINKRVIVTNSTMRPYNWNLREFTFDGKSEPLNRGVNVKTYYSRYNTNAQTFEGTEVILKKLNSVKDEFVKQRNEVSSIIESVTTDTKLLELLPEIKKYYPKPEKAPATQLVAVDQIKNVKSLL